MSGLQNFGTLTASYDNFSCDCKKNQAKAGSLTVQIERLCVTNPGLLSTTGYNVCVRHLIPLDESCSEEQALMIIA